MKSSDITFTGISSLREKYGVLRKHCRVQPMASDHVIVPRRTGGVTAYAVGEGDEVTASDKAWDQVTLTAKKWSVLTKYSSELAEDAVIDIADDLADEVAYAFATKEDDCGFNGTGTSAYHGIHGIVTKFNDQVGVYTGAVDGAANHDSFAEMDAADLAAVVGTLPQYALPRAAWWVSTVGKSLMFDRLIAAAGGVSGRELAEGFAPSYMGYPIIIAQKMPTSTADISDTVMALFGDMSMAVMLGDRRGTRIKVDSSRYLEYDQLAILGTTRFDINVHDIGSATAAGPVVALMAE